MSHLSLGNSNRLSGPWRTWWRLWHLSTASMPTVTVPIHIANRYWGCSTTRISPTTILQCTCTCTCICNINILVYVNLCSKGLLVVYRPYTINTGSTAGVQVVILIVKPYRCSHTVVWLICISTVSVWSTIVPFWPLTIGSIWLVSSY